MTQETRNTPTWHMELWIDNTEPLYREAVLITEASDTIEEIARGFKSAFTGMCGDLQEYQYALVDWLSIAENYAEDYA